jgi:hypothetical protein
MVEIMGIFHYLPSGTNNFSGVLEKALVNIKFTFGV